MRNLAFLHVAYGTLLRIGELARLRVRDVDRAGDGRIPSRWLDQDGGGGRRTGQGTELGLDTTPGGVDGGSGSGGRAGRFSVLPGTPY